MTHETPVWRERANFVIASRIPEGGEIEFEQLWCRQVDARRFELCCIPFYLYDMALGDIVETDEDYMVIRVTEPSWRYVFRVWLGESEHPIRDRVARQLDALEALLEWRSTNLLAIDARDQKHARVIAAFLAQAEAQRELVYETGRS